MTKSAGTLMMILAEGVLVVAKATAIRVSTMKTVLEDTKVDDWVPGVLGRRGTSRVFPAK